MFYYLQGTVALLEANLAVIDCGGVGYACHTTAYTLSQLRQGQKHRLYTYCNIREDAFDIFGFATREELRCFELLLGVTGVGPKAAVAILSVLSPERLMLAVAAGDEKAVTMAQGVGKKMAQRIILELKDKMGAAMTDMEGAAPTKAGAALEEGKISTAIAALAELGYSQSEAAAALRGADERLSVEELVRYGLRAMVLQ